ncbi:hypothetical protein KA405_03000, partial [Patescibacteria group bacterium]|nr:hypothetical protein [Patescibacteria group bacterium]
MVEEKEDHQQVEIDQLMDLMDEVDLETEHLKDHLVLQKDLHMGREIKNPMELENLNEKKEDIRK